MGEVCQVCQSSYFGRQHVNAHPAFKILPGCTCHANPIPNDLDQGSHESPPPNLKSATEKLVGAVAKAAADATQGIVDAGHSAVQSATKYLGIHGKPIDSYLEPSEAKQSDQSERSERSGPNDTADDSEYDS